MGNEGFIAKTPQISPAKEHIDHEYQYVTKEQLGSIRAEYAWLVQPIEKASDYVLEMPFFSFIRNMKDAHEFYFCAQQLWHHSATFPKVMGLMLGLTR